MVIYIKLFKSKQWLREGNCKKCIKNDYCAKACDKRKEYFRRKTFYSMINSIMNENY